MTSIRTCTLALLGLVLGGCSTTTAARRADGASPASPAAKPRVVVTADPELDDSNSLLRYLLYATDFRTEGLVYASSQFHWKGDGTGKKFSVPNREYFRFGQKLCPCESWRWAPNERFIDDAVDVYERVYPNLRVHHRDYPTPAELRSKIRWGNVEFDGDFSKDTPGSDLIRGLLLDDDPAPVYLLAWGGASTIARALKSIQDRHERTPEWPAIRAKVSRKAILSLSGDQDDTYATYIKPNWPDVRSLAIGQGGVGVAYGAFVFASAENAPYFNVDWTRENVSSKGPIGAHYRVWGDGKQMVPGDRYDYFGIAGLSTDSLRKLGYVVWLPPRPKGEFLGEGDDFTFFNLVGNGLDAHRDGTPGGWGGRVVVNPASRVATPAAGQGGMGGGIEAFMRSLEGIGPEGPRTRPPSPQPNFAPAAQNDFAARVRWSVTSTFAGANHEPVVTIRGSARVSARPGETVRLEGAVSDPDGNAVTVKWWRWKDVDGYPGDIALASPTSLATSVTVPSDAVAGQTIQLVLEATDDGTPALTRYRRVVISVSGEAARASDSAAVARTIARFHDALAAGDSAGALALLAPDATVLESGGVETYEEYRAHHLPADIGFARAVKSVRGAVSVFVRGDVAWASSTSTADGEYGGRVVRSAGAELMVLTRVPGAPSGDGWRISAIHWSSRTRRP